MRPIASSYFRQVLGTYLVRILLIPLGLFYGVITARWLGPTNLGLFATIGTILGTVSQLGQFGLPVGAARFVAEDPKSLSALLANARWSGLACGIAGILAIAGTAVAAPSALGAVPVPVLLLAASALPFQFASSQYQFLLLGTQRVRTYNGTEVLDRVLLLAGCVLTLMVLGAGLPGLVAFTVIAAAVQFGVYQWLFWPSSGRLKPDLQLFERVVRYSGRAYAGSLLAYLVLRSDILLINAMLGPDPTAVYAIAVRPLDFLLLLPGVAATLLFQRIAAQGKAEGAHFTAAVCRHAALVVGAACLCLAAVAWWLLPFLFGETYRASCASLWVLLPGVWCMSLQAILAHDLGGRDYPWAVLHIWALQLVTNVALNLYLIPKIGIVGAAASSTVAYALGLALMAGYWQRRFPEVRPRQLLLLERGEYRLLWDRAREAVRRG